MSSANLPRPRSRRFSSLRGRGLPTQFLLSVPELTCWSSASYVLKSRRAALDGQPGAAVPTYLLKGCLQSVDEFLHLLSTQRLEQPARNRSQPSKDLCFSLPSHFSSAVHRRQIESSRQRNISTCHTALTLILRTFRAIGFGELHFHFRRPLDVGNPDIHFDSKVCCILLRHPLKIRQQRSESLGIGEEVIHFFRRFFDLKLPTELDRHYLTSPSYSARPTGSL